MEELKKAIAFNEYHQVKEILETSSTSPINFINKKFKYSSESPLTLALKQQDIALLLIENGADINYKDIKSGDDDDEYEYSPLEWACLKGNKRTFDFFVAVYIEKFGKDSLINAIQTNNQFFYEFYDYLERRAEMYPKIIEPFKAMFKETIFPIFYQNKTDKLKRYLESNIANRFLDFFLNFLSREEIEYLYSTYKYEKIQDFLLDKFL